MDSGGFGERRPSVLFNLIGVFEDTHKVSL